MKSSGKRQRGRLTWRYLLKRGCSYRALDRGDYAWLWAAYNKGDFKEIGFEGGMSQRVFIQTLDLMFKYFLDKGGNVVLGFANVKLEDILQNAPVCITLVDQSQEAYWPHVIWFEWSTSRNRIESSVNFLKDLIKDGNVIIFSERSTEHFFGHMARYGLFNRRGTLKKYWSDGGDAIIYQGRK